MMQCELCGSTLGVETATLSIDGDTLELLLCADDRKKVARPWRSKGRVTGHRRISSPEGHKVEPFTFRPSSK